MAAIATLKFSGPSKGKSSDGTTYSASATKLWDVINAASMDEALAASGVADINDSYDGTNSTLKCRNVLARPVGYNAYEVTASYEIPPTGSWVTSPTGSDPLNQPAIIKWTSNIIEIDIDRDIDGNPIINANRDAFDPPPTKTIVKKTLQITKNFAYYDYPSAKLFENTVNSDAIVKTMPNGHTVTFPIGSIKCQTIEPASSYKTTDTFVPMTGTWEIYEHEDGVAYQYPHQLRLLHQGKTGYYDAGGGTKKTGRFVHDRGQEVSGDVRLKQDGTPYDTTLKVQNLDVISAPVASPSIPGWVVWEVGSDATWIRFKRYRTVAMTSLFISFGV